MLEAHAPHEAIHTWQSFFIHIGTIVVGLIIAVALEQTVEQLHHRHQRLQLEEQMHGVLEKDMLFAARDTASLNELRSYLVNLQHALAARRLGLSVPAAPAANDLRSTAILNLPGLAPYDAAKENGTVALLSSEQIRIYNRVDSQRGFLLNAVTVFNDALSGVNAFNDRFDPTVDGFAFVQIGSVPDLVRLSAAELAEYQALIGTLTNATDMLSARVSLFAIECRLILDGARDDNDFIDHLTAQIRAHSRLKDFPSTTH